jgi:large subunit ribosomal protein L24
MKIRKGDKVKIMVGKDRGRDGTVDRVYAKQNKVLVPGVNIYKRHIKKNENTKEGGIIDIPRPLDVSKVMLVCPKCKKLTKVGYSVEKKRKYRICKKCKSKI